ncbi:hypothetical protein NliqN6_5375 [Naganishia liquefaciens]|uniref:Uncharacterized protein n=1 Tax=Naganishia liquefaciens TaxID=104408 RepID=A0A8H3YH47_9TREE|nr:hypothetical protein NliqN6_5375 [Naganishia liquefaciens]
MSSQMPQSPLSVTLKVHDRGVDISKEDIEKILDAINKLAEDLSPLSPSRAIWDQKISLRYVKWCVDRAKEECKAAASYAASWAMPQGYGGRDTPLSQTDQRGQQQRPRGQRISSMSSSREGHEHLDSDALQHNRKVAGIMGHCRFWIEEVAKKLIKMDLTLDERSRLQQLINNCFSAGLRNARLNGKHDQLVWMTIYEDVAEDGSSFYNSMFSGVPTHPGDNLHDLRDPSWMDRRHEIVTLSLEDLPSVRSCADLSPLLRSLSADAKSILLEDLYLLSRNSDYRDQDLNFSTVSHGGAALLVAAVIADVVVFPMPSIAKP